jgi:hypothetical protein
VGDRAGELTAARRAALFLHPVVLGCALIVIAAVPYLAGGIAHAFFAGDDFDLLAASLASGWHRIFVLAGRGSYRPMTDLWFAAAAATCGTSGCYHLLSLAVHLVSVGLVFALARALFRDLRIAVLGSVLFALEPASVQAVTWVAAIPDLLGACLFLAALFAVAQSWTATNRRSAIELCAVVLFASALFAHESPIVALAVVPIMWYHFGPSDWSRRRVLLVGAPAAAAAFALTTFLVYRRSYLFTESHYTFGIHMLRHAFEYIVELYVGPKSWFAFSACAAGLALLLMFTPVTRFAALWMLVTLVPYLGFTWENVSRYHYVPAVGFAWAVAAALTSGFDWLTARFSRYRLGVRVAYVIVAIFITLRFARFCVPAVRSQVEWLDEWRTYADRVVADNPHPVGNTIQLGPPPDPIERPFLGAMVRWLYRDPAMITIVR